MSRARRSLFTGRGVLVRVVAVVLCLLAWQATTLPQVGTAERAALEQRFSFQRLPVNEASVPGTGLRPVAPAYDRIPAWISAVGAGSGLFDADGDGRSGDLCLVDPRTDLATVRAAPAGGGRYAPVVLRLDGLAQPAATAPMGCLPADLNSDGVQDVLVYYWGRSPVLFLGTRAAAGSAPAYRPRELVSPWQRWNSNAATVGDFDGDGGLDLVVGNYFPDGARVLDPTAPRGGPEQMPDSLSAAYNGGTNRLLRFVGGRGGADPDARFEEVPGVFDAGQARQWTLALGAQDLDGNGLPDLYVGNDFGPDRLLLNTSRPGAVSFRELRGVRHATTPKSKVLGRDSFKGMGVAFTDLNSDGTPDILASNITNEYALLESNFAFLSWGRPGDHGEVAPYDDHSESLGLSRTGWGWDILAADFDSDGTDEVVQATGFLRGDEKRWAQLQETAMSNDLVVRHPGLWPEFGAGADLSGRDRDAFFVRGRDGRFIDVAEGIGLGSDSVSRGLSVGDVDGDGRPDLVIAGQWAPSTLHRNVSPARPALILRLVQPAACGAAAGAPTRPAIGAGVRVTVGDQVRHRQLYPANGHGGVDAPEVHVGLGRATGPVPVDLTWRDACGTRHSTTVPLRPGVQRLVLNPDGTAEGARP